MPGVSGRWCVQRFEPPLVDDYGPGRESFRREGDEKVCYSWREACEAVTLAIGPNCLQHGVEADGPVIFERDGAVIVVYMKLVF